MNPNKPRPGQHVERSFSIPKNDHPAFGGKASSDECLDDQYQIILDNITDGVYAIDLNWRVTYFNRAAEKITGIPVKEAIGRSCFEVFRSNVCESNCVLRETLDTGSLFSAKPWIPVPRSSTDPSILFVPTKNGSLSVPRQRC